jgi:hypothetical protein
MWFLNNKVLLTRDSLAKKEMGVRNFAFAAQPEAV